MPNPYPTAVPGLCLDGAALPNDARGV